MFLLVQARRPFTVKAELAAETVYHRESKALGTVTIYAKATPKDVSDTRFEVTEGTAFLLEGVLVNAGELTNRFALKTRRELIQTALAKEPDQLLAQLHGQFCGLVYDVKAEQIRIFTNQTNSLRIYYYKSEELFLAGTSIQTLNQLLLANGIKTGLDETGCRMLLTYGYTLTDYTTIKEIRHLQAGQFIRLTESGVVVGTYHQFTNESKHTDLGSAIAELQRLFEQAVRNSFETDNLFGKKHLAFLSGG